MKRPADDLLSRLRQIEEIVSVPQVVGHSASPKALALSIARQAPNAAIEQLAMQLSVEIASLTGADLPVSPSNVRLNKLFWRLRRALEQARWG